MTRARASVQTSFAIGLTLLGVGCPTTYVSLGEDDAGDGAAGNVAGQSGGAGIGGVAGVGDVGGVGGTAGGCAGSGAGAIGDSYCGTCAPTDEALSNCEYQLPTSLSYGYHACLNAQDGVGGGPAVQCEGYQPCSFQHEGCLDFYSGGLAGSAADSARCGSEAGAGDWLSNCGGFGYYGPDITAGAGGAGGSAGIGCDPALDHCGSGGAGGTADGIAGTTEGGAGGGVAGTGAGGVAGETSGSAGAGITGGEGGS
jgi:hypothetical protein